MPDVNSTADFMPFGLQKPGRNTGADSYRYAFQGMSYKTSVSDSGTHVLLIPTEASGETDAEKTGNHGGSYTTEFRQYDPRLGRWLSTDPVIKFALNPYNALSNNPIVNTDPRGDDDFFDENGNFLFSSYGWSFKLDMEQNLRFTVTTNDIKILKKADYDQMIAEVQKLNLQGEDKQHFMVIQSQQAKGYNEYNYDLIKKIVGYYARETGYKVSDINNLHITLSKHGLGASSRYDFIEVPSNFDACNLKFLLLKELFHWRYYQKHGLKNADDWRKHFPDKVKHISHDLKGYEFMLANYKALFNKTTMEFKDNVVTGAGAFIADLYGLSELWRKNQYASDLARTTAETHQKTLEWLLGISYLNLQQLGQQAPNSYPENTITPTSQKSVKYDPPMFKN